MYQRGDTGATVIAVVALILAIAAGVLAWVAYDRTGGDLDERIQKSINQMTTDSDVDGPTELNDTPTSGSTDTTDETSEGSTTMPSTDTQTVPQTQP